MNFYLSKDLGESLPPLTKSLNYLTFLFCTIKTHFSQQRFPYEFEGSTSPLRKTGLHRQFSRELVHIVSPPFTCETAVLIVLGSVCEVFFTHLEPFPAAGLMVQPLLSPEPEAAVPGKAGDPCSTGDQKSPYLSSCPFPFRYLCCEKHDLFYIFLPT